MNFKFSTFAKPFKFSLGLILVFLVSCRQDDEINLDNDGVLAGVVSKDMIYNDFEPDIVVDSLPDTVLFGGNVKFLDVDVNKDGIKDIRLGSHSHESSNIGYFLATELTPYNTQKNRISIYASDTFYVLDGPFFNSYGCSGLVRKLKYKEIVNQKTAIWTTTDTSYLGLPVRNSYFGLASKNVHSEDMYLSYGNNNWRNTNNGYMGLRFINNCDTIYGWVRMSVINYSKIVLHDCAYQYKH